MSKFLEAWFPETEEEEKWLVLECPDAADTTLTGCVCEITGVRLCGKWKIGNTGITCFFVVVVGAKVVGAGVGARVVVGAAVGARVVVGAAVGAGVCTTGAGVCTTGAGVCTTGAGVCTTGAGVAGAGVAGAGVTAGITRQSGLISVHGLPLPPV